MTVVGELSCKICEPVRIETDRKKNNDDDDDGRRTNKTFFVDDRRGVSLLNRPEHKFCLVPYKTHQNVE